VPYYPAEVSAVLFDEKSPSFEVRGVPRDKLRDQCPDCGSIITGRTVDELLAASCACRMKSMLKDRVELACMQCGREVGSGTVAHASAHILIPEALRCGVCGGRPVVTDRSTVRVYL
jgi:DNA-directed RNA polymerase subunit RPC12/RpoP